ncbi:MAG: bifunctional folylpolyglutamate synthase/dihydrofolate synthase [Lachnospiraceae bacterium]|nr:bifunctional folylpolyglutamate synthase/dihydrofolate synthase [Lachnospiraceae bacterium]
MTKNQLLSFLQSYSNSGSALGLSRVELLLDYLSHPEKKLKFVHVAGTNGKGSTIAFLSSVLSQAGYRVGRFQSPWIFDYEEQIRIGETLISEEDLIAVGKEVISCAKQMVKDGYEMPTEFEMLVPMAFLYFLKQNCDIVLLEVGLGGEGDATNVIPTPLISVITKISYDHMNYLGETIEEIAMAKAGIIKEGGKVVLSPQPREAEEVFSKRINLCHGDLFEWKEIPKEFVLGLKGGYQRENASLAYTTLLLLQQLGYEISNEDMKKGFESATWPGRFEVLKEQPLFLVDGAHNEDGARALAKALEETYPDKKFSVIIGILADKEYEKILDLMLPYANKVFCITPENPRALPKEDLKQVIVEKKKGLPVTCCESLFDALKESYYNDNEPTLAFGSLYYVGKIRKLFFDIDR